MADTVIPVFVEGDTGHVGTCHREHTGRSLVSSVCKKWRVAVEKLC